MGEWGAGPLLSKGRRAEKLVYKHRLYVVTVTIFFPSSGLFPARIVDAARSTTLYPTVRCNSFTSCSPKPDVIEPALHLRMAQGYPGAKRTYNIRNYINRQGAIEFR